MRADGPLVAGPVRVIALKISAPMGFGASLRTTTQHGGMGSDFRARS